MVYAATVPSCAGRLLPFRSRHWPPIECSSSIGVTTPQSLSSSRMAGARSARRGLCRSSSTRGATDDSIWSPTTNLTPCSLPSSTVTKDITYCYGPKKDQLVASPYTGRTRWVSLNTKVKPFDDINVRKAVFAGIDRKAMNLAFGGETVGKIATHIIPPGVAGFDQAGGLAVPTSTSSRSRRATPSWPRPTSRRPGSRTASTAARRS